MRVPYFLVLAAGLALSNAAAAQTQITPGAQIRPQQQLPGQVRPVTPLRPETPPTPVTDTEVAIEPGGRPEDMVLHVMPTTGISFHGRSAALPAPALAPHVARITGGRIDTLGVRLQASAPGATPTPRSAATPETPRYRLGATGAVILRVPVSLRDLPEDAIGLSVSCGLYASRQVPSPVATSPFRDIASTGAAADERRVARGEAEAFIRNIGRYEMTFDIPMQLRPFYRLSDARSYQCGVTMLVDRVTQPGVDRISLTFISDPRRPSSRPPYRPAAGTTPIYVVEGNLQ